jgi:patatin-like phospholipase/acyl hydrolase
MRVLSIDGGGIRGVIPASMLAEVERMIQDREGPEARLGDYFDLVAGTSTGGIIAGLLVLPEVDRTAEGGRQGWHVIRTAQDVVQFYLTYGATLFRRSLGQRVRRVGGLADERYGPTGFNQVLDEILGPRDGPGPELMLSDLARPTVISTYNATSGNPYFFKQHRAELPGGLDFALRDVALATAAAPTYFETADVMSDQGELGACVDGGVVANNPAMCAYAEANGFFGHGPEDIAVLSLGTGSSLKNYTYEEMKNWGVTRWMKPVLDMMMAGSSRAVDYQLRQVFDIAPGADDAQYLRLQADLGPEEPSVAKMDNVDPDNLWRLVEIGRELVDTNRESLERFVDAQILGPPEPGPGPDGDRQGEVADARD